jgi:type IV secretion system protein VirB2
MKEVQYVGDHAIQRNEVAMRWVILCVLALLLLIASDVALAQTTDAFVGTKISTALKNLVATLNGTVARSLAIIAVIGTGIAALTGRMEWSKAVVVVLGVGVIFSATSLIDTLFGISVT